MDVFNDQISDQQLMEIMAAMNEEETTPEELSFDEDLLFGGDSGEKSILTFNASVSNKKVISDLQHTPFQIMASTQNFLTTKTINSYPVVKNPNLLLHMNYITRVFNHNAIEANSKERLGLRQYVKLAERVGTKDILIHMPTNGVEVGHIPQGLKVINEELVKKGLIVHLEIAAWTQEVITCWNIRSKASEGKVEEYISEFIDDVMNTAHKLSKNGFKLVLDTAHLFALGAEADVQIKLFRKYKGLMKYAHLNGNVNNKLMSDSHTPIMNANSKLHNWQQLCMCISKLGLICVAEITKYGKEWSDWEKFAKEFNFELVPYHEAYSI